MKVRSNTGVGREAGERREGRKDRGRVPAAEEE